MKWNLSDPPRDVPMLVKLRLLCGGFNNQLGWLFFGFGMIFAWAFIGQADLTQLVPGDETGFEEVRKSRRRAARGVARTRQ